MIGHRGAAARAPENTLAALRCAKVLGCAWVEFDVRLTADGAPVLFHDSRLDRTTSGSGAVSTHSFAAIRACDAGSWFGPQFAGERVPTLQEALLLAAELGLSANIDIKADRGRVHETAAAVAAVLGRLDGRLPPLLVSSFLTPALSAMRALAPSVPRGLVLRTMWWRWGAVAERLRAAAIIINHRWLGPRLAGAIRAAGYPLLAYTVNDPERARRLYGWGVTSVFSHAPDIILPIAAPGGVARDAAPAAEAPHVAKG